MKKLALLCMCITTISYGLFAQCTTCVPSHLGCTPSGGLCARVTGGMVNHPYSSTISFLMPGKLNDPSILSQCQCSEVDLKKIKITGVGGLPAGISYVFDKPVAPYYGYYDVSAGDSLGCGHFCGTPLVAGKYPIKVFIEANVLAVGTPIGNVDPGPQNQSYVDTIVILPDTSGGVSSFTYTPQQKEDCDSVRIALNAILTAAAPNITTYNWDFGNGNHSTDKNPTGTQFYNTAGKFPVSLETKFYKYKIKKIYVNWFGCGYAGDFPGCGEVACTAIELPDPYFKIPLINQKTASQSNITHATFNNLNYVLPTGTTSFSIELWDEDPTGTICSALGNGDDKEGSFNIFVNGQLQVNFSDANASGYVEFDTILDTRIVDTLWVNIKGRPAIPVIGSPRDSICFGDSVRLLVSPAYTNAQFDWYEGGSQIIGAKDSFYYSNHSGTFHVMVTDLGTGCNKVTDSLHFKTIHQAPSLPSSSTINYDQGSNSFFLTPFPGGMVARWFFNGLEVSGQTGQILPSLGDGTYAAIISPAGFGFCTRTVEDLVFTKPVNSIANVPDDITSLSVYPNPSKGVFTVHAKLNTNEEIEIKILDMIGRTVYDQHIAAQRGDINTTVDLSNLTADIYVMETTTPKGTLTTRIAISK